MYKHTMLSKLNADIRSKVGTRDARMHFTEEVTRKHLITRQDCLNITRKVRDFSSHRHTEDAIFTDRIVRELEKEIPSPVLLYKPQFQASSDFPILPDDTFLMVVMTQFQLEMLIQFSHKLVSLDSTHNTNQYGFKLITLVVADEFRNGWYHSTKQTHMLGCVGSTMCTCIRPHFVQ